MIIVACVMCIYNINVVDVRMHGIVVEYVIHLSAINRLTTNLHIACIR